MRGNSTEIEKPVIGYIVIAVALLVGMLTASAFAQTPIQIKTRIAPNQVNTRLLPVGESGHLHVRRHWILGVRADATDTGYLVRHVEHHSAASKVGIEPGDRIVAVDGNQIGFVGHDLTPLSDTLERCGGSDGRVRLLIQNRRNRRLVSLSVTLNHVNHHLGH